MSDTEKETGYIYIKVKVVGGELPGTTIVQKIGPLGLPPKVVGEDVRKATADFKGIKLQVRLAIKDRKARVDVFPGTSALILKALNEPPRDRKKVKNVLHQGSITMIDVINIARTKSVNSQSKTLSGVVKEVLGTCVSIGCRIDGKMPKDVISDIQSGEMILPSK